VQRGSFTMSGFCDECGASFLRSTSKWCNECGTARSTLAEVGMHVEVVRSGVDTTMEADESALDMPLWVLQDHPNVTLQTRIYGKRPPGLGRSILWGKRFLKEHHCYRRQYKKLLRNQRILHKWFQPGIDAFVDDFLTFDSLCWKKEYLKELCKYVQARRKRTEEKEEDNITDINFLIEGLSVHWKTSEIHKKYKKNPKSIPKQLCTKGAIDNSEEILAIGSSEEAPAPKDTITTSSDVGAPLAAEVLAIVGVSQSMTGMGISGSPTHVCPRVQRQRRLPSRLREN
jgi:hypothetical protein